MVLCFLTGFATLLLLGGSFLVLASPGDGQTGMIVLPCYVVGMVCGVIALVLAFYGHDLMARKIVFGCAAVSVASIVGAVVVALRYGRNDGST